MSILYLTEGRVAFLLFHAARPVVSKSSAEPENAPWLFVVRIEEWIVQQLSNYGDD
jgi:hypothetical protein